MTRVKSATETVLSGASITLGKSYKGVANDNNSHDVWGGEASENAYLPIKSYYYIVNIKGEPVCLDTLQSGDPNIRATRSLYTIQYIPKNSPARRGKYCYLIGQDLLRMRILVSGPDHWYGLCSRIPELRWLNQYTTISPELFGIAKMHPGTIFRFGIDFVRYARIIEEKAKRQGIDIDHKPFVTYAYTRDVYEKYKDKKFASIRTKQDYLDEIEAAKAEAEGNDEE